VICQSIALGYKERVMSNGSVEEIPMSRRSIAGKRRVYLVIHSIIPWFIGLYCGLVFSLAWSPAIAIAVPLPSVLASTPDAIKDLANEVEESVDDLSRARAGERDGIGTVERHVGVRRQIETGKQIEGRARRELERSQRTSQEIKTKIQNAADDLSDRVKGAFGE
jgi:hypothetical protein